MDTYDAPARRVYMALGIVVGAMAGVGLGMLVAPRSGQETRGMLRERAVAAKQKARDQIAQKRQMAMDAVGRTAERSRQALSKAQEAAGDIRDQAASNRASSRGSGRSRG